MIMKLITAFLLVFSLGANAAWHLDQMNVPQAWTVTHGEGVTVGIVGSGDSHDTIVEAAIKQVAPNAQTTFCIMRRTDSKNMANCIKSLADSGADMVNVSYVPVMVERALLRPQTTQDQAAHWWYGPQVTST